MLITPIKPNTFPHSAMPANIRGEYPNKVKQLSCLKHLPDCKKKFFDYRDSCLKQ